MSRVSNFATDFDSQHYRYPSRRNVVYASRAMVASSQPLASQAGLEVLKKGGNAVDAAIAVAAALTVVEPTSNGLGSDAFAIIWKDGKLHGINGSGFAPSAWSLENFKSHGWTSIPKNGWGAATVPGAIATWCELSRKMGALPLTEVLAPAIEYARNGFAVSPTAAYNWDKSVLRFTQAASELPELAAWAETFAPTGHAPKAGTIFKSETHAATLERIAETNGTAFYTGDIAEKIVKFAQATGGFFTLDDLAEFAPEWVDPISINYRGYDVWEIPPNGQGICALMALNVLKNFDFDLTARDCAVTYHRQIEAIKLGFADAHRYVADQRFSQVPVCELLSSSYGQERSRLISPDVALDHKAGNPFASGTVYFAVADLRAGHECMVSFIQSNYMGFGSGVVIPGTGIALNNRGHCFKLDPSHPNVIAPRKRPYNTIIPGFLTKDGAPVGPFGVMGGFMQPQGHVQVITNMIDFGMNPQEALDAPRWQYTGGDSGLHVAIEPNFPASEALKLAAMGHEIVPSVTFNDFGRGQIILRTGDGTLIGGTEPRADGTIAAW